VTVHIPQVLAAEFWSRWPDEFRPSPPSTAPLAAAGSCDRAPDGPGADSLAAVGTTNPNAARDRAIRRTRRRSGRGDHV